MDTAAYKEQFVSEARDNLEDLNTNLVELEKDQSEDLINKIFRGFHTLKGNAATMGYKKFSEVAHDLEDLLDRVRNKKMSLDTAVVDVLLDGMDTLNDGLNLIEDDHGEDLATQDILRSIKSVIGDSDGPAVEAYHPPAKLDVKLPKKNSNWRILLKWKPDNQLRLPKSRLALKHISTFGQIVACFPDLSDKDLTSKDVGTMFDIVVNTTSDLDTIKKKISSIVGLEIIAGDALGSLEIPKEHIAEQHESEKANIADKHLNSAVKQVQSVKVDILQLDKLMNLVGELLISKMRLQQTANDKQDRELTELVVQLDRLSSELQNEVMTVRMIPIGYIFNKFPRMVRDLAKKEEKQIELIMEGQELELDRTILDQIGDPLVHLLRNSIDHGIELPEERENQGKNPTGTVKLIARREENHAVIEITDDGAGIDGEVVKKAAIKKGKITAEEAAQMSDQDAQRLIFLPSVSTNEQVTDVSGRGVGMDVVETKIKALGGNVKLFSEVGKGSTVILQLPLTVAIISALLVKIGKSTYAVPLSSINRTVTLKDVTTKTIQGKNVIILDDQAIRYVDLYGELNETQDPGESPTIIIADIDNHQVALPVDDVISQQQILIKNIGNYTNGAKKVAGATILGDGSVALILNIAALG